MSGLAPVGEPAAPLEPAIEIRRAWPRDLAAVDELTSRTFGQLAGSVFAGVPADVQIRLRLALRRLEPHPTDGLIVAVAHQSIVATIAVETAENDHRPGLAVLAVLRPLGVRGIARFYSSALVAAYPPAADEAYLSTLIVAPSHRRRGIAERLLRAAEGEAVVRGKQVLTALVAPENRASLALFEKAGFRRHAAGGRWRWLIPGWGAVHLRKELR